MHTAKLYIYRWHLSSASYAFRLNFAALEVEVTIYPACDGVGLDPAFQIDFIGLPFEVPTIFLQYFLLRLM